MSPRIQNASAAQCAIDHIPARRSWLLGMLGLAGTLAVCAAIPRSRSGSLAGQLQAWLGRRNSDGTNATQMRRLGWLYLGDHPQERDFALLERLLAGAPHESVRSALIGHVQRDWHDHEIVVLDGWVFARTEARVCAALHLMHEGRT